MTRKRWIIVGVIVVALIAGAAWLLESNQATANTPYRLATIERGDLEETIAATGVVQALQTVAIGTQVSGQITGLYADFNDRVREGQLLARIDSTLQEQAVRNARAALERAQADLRRTEEEYERSRILFDQKVITEAEFSQIEYNLAASRSALTSATVNLEQAERNLAYTRIYSPIDGVVIERNAEVGQTVAATMSTPQLYLLANDLSQLEIHASVDESDIGMIEPGQPVRFTVQAYRDERFEGIVRQVRLQSVTTENVVNYSVVISVDNPDLRLLPGMTAMVDFIVRQAEDVYKVSNAALRFTPTPEMLAELGERGMPTPAGAGQRGGEGGEGGEGMATRIQAPGGGAFPGGPGGGAFPGGPGGNGFPGAASRAVRRNGSGGGFATLWYLDDNDRLAVMQVRTGISDGAQTEISGPDVREGLRVIAGINIPSPSSAPQATSNPFQQNRSGNNVRFRGPGGF